MSIGSTSSSTASIASSRCSLHSWSVISLSTSVSGSGGGVALPSYRRAGTRGTEHHRNDTGMARVHVNQAQCGEGRACRRCRHAPHVAARQERRA